MSDSSDTTKIDLNEMHEGKRRYGLLNCGGRWDRKESREIPASTIKPLLKEMEQEVAQVTPKPQTVRPLKVQPTVVHSEAGW